MRQLTKREKICSLVFFLLLVAVPTVVFAAVKMPAPVVQVVAGFGYVMLVLCLFAVAAGLSYGSTRHAHPERFPEEARRELNRRSIA